jgi:hypothetical protein
LKEYENEKCVACVYFEPGSEGRCCNAERNYIHQTHTQPFLASCEHFEPSLLCRQVRAQEMIGDVLSDLIQFRQTESGTVYSFINVEQA